MEEEEVGERNSEPYTAVRRKYRLDRSIGSRVKTRDRERGLCWMRERERDDTAARRGKKLGGWRREEREKGSKKRGKEEIQEVAGW